MKQAMFIFEIFLDQDGQDLVVIRNGQNGQALACTRSLSAASKKLSEMVEDFRKFDPSQADRK